VHVSKTQKARSKKQDASSKKQEARSKKQERLRWVDNSKFCYILPINDLISKSHGENFLMSCSESRLGLPEVASPPTAKAGERRLKCVEATLGSDSTFSGRGAEFRFPASSCPPFRDCRGPEVPRVIVWSCSGFLLSWHRLEQGLPPYDDPSAALES
jgi:hypothetical protein